MLILCSFWGCTDNPEGISGEVTEAPEASVTAEETTSVTEETAPRGALKEYITASHGVFDGLVRVCDDHKWGYVNIDGVEVIPTQYNAAGDFREGLARVKKNSRWGYVNTSGEAAIPCSYTGARDFSDGYAAVKNGGEWGFITPDGKTKVPFHYEEALDFSENFAAVKKNGKWGYVSTEGNELPFLYDEAKEFSDGYAAVKQNGKWGYIDQNGGLKIECVYDEAEPFVEEHYAVVKQGEDYYLIGKDGKSIAKSCTKIVNFWDGAAIYHETLTTTTVINANCEKIIELDFYPHSFVASEERIVVYDDLRGKAVAYDMSGNIVFEKPCQEALWGYSEGLIGLYYCDYENNPDSIGNMVFYDKDGEEVFALPQNTGGAHGVFINGFLGAYNFGGRYEGYINKTGEFVIEPRFYSVWSFDDGLALVMYDRYGDYALINEKGEDVIAFRYSLWDYYDMNASEEEIY